MATPTLDRDGVRHALRALLGPGEVLAGPDQVEPYRHDWFGDFAGWPLAVVRPGTTEQVAALVRLCAQLGVPVVPQGGQTGLVGGAVPSMDGGEVVINLARMNRIRSIDPVGFTLVAEAGCILADLHAAALGQDLYLPLSLGAQGSCQVGGNAATNAGGSNVLRYGMARDLILGLEVVLPDGTVWNGLRQLRKNNAGYDLKQLFVGSEGTLGIITALSLRLFPRPTQVQTAMLGVASIDDAMKLYGAARRDLSDLLSAFELMPGACIDLTRDFNPALRDPLQSRPPVYVLMQASASGLVDLAGLVERHLAAMFESGLVVDGAVAASEAQQAQFWRLREDLVEAQHAWGRHLRTDVSVPIACIPDFMAEAERQIARDLPDAIRIAYGHVGDGNIHYNVLPPRGMAEAEAGAMLHAAEALIFALVDRFEGSISAEHGIGRLKRAALDDLLSPAHRRLLRVVKSGIDPQGIMNPGRILAA